MGPGEPRLPGDRLLEKGCGALIALPIEPEQVVKAEVIGRPCVEILRRRQRPPGLVERDPQFEGADHRLDDPGADFVHRPDFGAVALAPHDALVPGVAQLDRHDDAAAFDFDHAGEAIAHAKRGPDPVDPGVGAAKLEGRGARDHEQPAQARELDDEIVRQRIGDRAMGTRGADQGEGQDRDRRAGDLGGRRLDVGFARGGDGRMGGRAGRRHLAHEAEAELMDRTDQALGGAVIADRLARRLDPAGDRGVGDDPAPPDALDDLVPADQPFAVLDEQPQQGEHLGLDGHHAIAKAQFALAGVELIAVEDMDHRRRTIHLQNFSGKTPCHAQASRVAAP